MTVYNPRWLQIIFYVAIVGSPCLAGYVFYLGYSAFPESVFFGLLALVLSLAIVYLSYIGIRLAKFVPAKVTYDERQFHVTLEDATTSHQWSDISSIKNYKITQTLVLLNTSGEIIYAVDYLTPGYKAFA